MDNRRKQYWVDKGFQKKTIFRLMLLVVGTVLGAHLVAMGYLKVMQAPKISAGLGAFSQAVNTNVLTPGFLSNLWLPALITCLLAIFFVLGFGLVYSHRISGPLFNLKRMLHKMSLGDLTGKMHIRATDEFHDLEDAFNHMAGELCRRHRVLRQALEALPAAEKRKILKTCDELFQISPSQLETAPEDAVV